MATLKWTCVQLAQELLNDDENDDDDNAIATAMIVDIMQTYSREPKKRIKSCCEDVVSKYSDFDFKRIFRLSRPTFDTIKGFLQDCHELVVEGQGSREPISVEKQLYVTLWYLGGSDSIIRIADRFGIAESSVVVCRNRIIDTILNNLKSKFINWQHAEILEQTIDKFHQRNGFPGVIGALDGTHISIKAPTENPQSYINRKGYYSLQLQAVCDSDMKFLNCFCGYAGSCHDARVLRNSDLWNYGLEVCNGNHIIADGAYPLRRWLMTPFRDNGHLLQEQKHLPAFCQWVVIERAFGLLKGRFRRLHHLDVLSIQTAVKIIMCTCILHNICLIQNEDIDDYMEPPEVDQPQISQLSVQENETEGIIKRNILCRRLRGH
ncbi:putative nuclease HARBI1 [Crassostrea angulata]|uniref:putative nuclease HARBI1 n=1 Tax=Magallana angulata TaxID=2784310 RepID=UPI0022B0A45C|nr:putative nuclease HARBI1 [Crassostrea angulata]